MTPHADPLTAITAQRLLAIIRLPDGASAVCACGVLAGAGVSAIEISLAQPDALDAIAGAAERAGDSACIGAGTVRTLALARAAVEAGARFLVAPGFDLEVATWAREQGVLYVPGAFTATEVENASRYASLVKLFPAGRLGPAYVADLLAPAPDARLVPTGGVDLDNARAFLEAGATAVAIGSALVNRASVADPERLANDARTFLHAAAPVG
jgi:2-dehydro-3-deoxyphosphogluconate aldolase/(4S)-4-hydroxy-2-oxoglutarate aldolase